MKPDVISCNAGISACERGGQWWQALSLLGEFGKARLDPQAIIYSGSICMCEQGGEWEQALSLLNELWEARS